MALIKKLQEVAWDMWDHRNGILKKDPERHKDRDPLAKADAAIEAEWEMGDTGLMRKDRFLFKDLQLVQNKTLPEKQI